MISDEAILLVILGLMLLCFGGYCLIFAFKFRLQGFRAFAQVESMIKIAHRDDNGNQYYIHKPIFEIIDEEGNSKSNWFSEASMQSHFGASWPVYQVGDVLEVYCIPRIEKIVSVKNINQALHIGGFLCLVGLSFFLAVLSRHSLW